METIALADSGRHTTRLGYGCTSLMGTMGRRESLAVLEAAYDAGVRHFDVAPMYGFGQAEGCLGEFLARHSGDVTVTTKYGIPAPKRTTLLGAARRVAGPVVKRIPGLKQRLLKVASAAAASPPKSLFSVEDARASLENSLAALRTERIDLWLLHEAEASDLNSDALLRLLQEEVSRGRVGSFGVGSEACKIPDMLAKRPPYCHVLQYEWSLLDAAIPDGDPFRIHHRALTGNFHALQNAFRSHADVCRTWSAEVGAELGDARKLASLMLKASLVMNPKSVILFSSKQPKHIAENVRVSTDASLETPARRLHHLMQTRRRELIPDAEADIR